MQTKEKRGNLFLRYVINFCFVNIQYIFKKMTIKMLKISKKYLDKGHNGESKEIHFCIIINF